MKPQTHVVADHGYVDEFELEGTESFKRILIVGLSLARVVVVQANDGGTAWVTLPVVVPSSGRSISFIQDRDMITVFGLDAYPGLVKLRVEWIVNG